MRHCRLSRKTLGPTSPSSAFAKTSGNLKLPATSSLQHLIASFATAAQTNAVDERLSRTSLEVLGGRDIPPSRNG